MTNGKQQSDSEWFKELRRKEIARNKKALADAKKNAVDKEPLDRDKFEKIYDVTPDYGSEVNWEEYEMKYSVRYPKVKTLAEFAAILEESDMYKGGDLGRDEFF